MSDKIEGKALNGYKVRSWGDLLAISTLISMFMGVCWWGLKLEGELNQVRNDLNSVSIRVADGILPRAEERINHHDTELREIRRRLERLEDDD